MGLISYFVPQKPQQKSNQKIADDDAQSNKSDEVPVSEATTPGVSSPWASRPASLLTEKEMSDTKCQIMVSWLHQQQIEKTWFDSQALDEGVVLKKSKDEYVCCPESLGDDPTGFCKAVQILNVRVRFHYSWSNVAIVFLLTVQVRPHSQHTRDQDLLA
jgi:hypothetical protein